MLASGSVSTLAAAPQGAAPGDPAPLTPPADRERLPDALIGLCLTAGLLAVAFVTSGGVDQTDRQRRATPGPRSCSPCSAPGRSSPSSCGGARGRAWGGGTVALMAALAALTALSIIWSVVPDTSWSAANQMLSYLAAFAGAVGAGAAGPRPLAGAAGGDRDADGGARADGRCWPRCSRSTLAPNHTTAGCEAPFGYWNAVGVSGALGLPAALWAGARRDRGRLLAGLTGAGDRR